MSVPVVEEALHQESGERPIVDEAAPVAVNAVARHLGVVVYIHENGIDDTYLLISANEGGSTVLTGRIGTGQAGETVGASVAAIYPDQRGE